MAGLRGKDLKTMALTRIAAAGFILIGLLFVVVPAKAGVEVRIDKSAQRMAVIVDGTPTYHWVVSTGLGGGPRSGVYTPKRLERKWNSRKYNWAPMPHAVFFHEGYAIHGTNHVRQLGQRASKGCVRLHPANAATLFALVQKHGMKSTRIVVGGSIAGVKKPIATKRVSSLP
jgi:lipoprotein-anchoring transpeptidase ErfK/SrfK